MIWHGYLRPNPPSEARVNTLTAYHGSSRAFPKPTEFHEPKSMDFGPGFYLSLSPKDAIGYGSNLHRAKVRLENPVVIGEEVDDDLVEWFKRALRVTDEDLEYHEHPIAGALAYFEELVRAGMLKPGALVSALKKKGYDGIYIEKDVAAAHNGVDTFGDFVVVWDPDQILEWQVMPLSEVRDIYHSELRKNSTPEEDARFRALIEQQFPGHFVRNIL